ncbi:probable G-protein coupled receptor 139 [Hypanus sabinus]|uniref:probable G-protein coupled receptor 139 n=1 Tax=Hypanus sabinus TaxID=79690 RepID=UPI0028C4FEDC|nr:probable G-protein coupled receptor 139 [Hypanus sabinus]
MDRRGMKTCGPCAVNLAAVVILCRGKCGLSPCTTRYLVAMAAADLLLIVSEVLLRQISYHHFPESFLHITPVCRIVFLLVRTSTDYSVWFTVVFTFDRFVAICLQKLRTKYCTEKTAVVVLGTTGILLALKNIPHYFTIEPWEIINNIPWDCHTKASIFIEPGWVGYDWFDSVLTPLLPFAFILLLNVLTVKYILVASRIRRRLRGANSADAAHDPEMESRRKSVILLFGLSANFILLWTVALAHFLYYTIAGKNPTDYNASEYNFHKVGFMLINLSCCTNTFIYGVTQSKFREQILFAVRYPVLPVILLIRRFRK